MRKHFQFELNFFLFSWACERLKLAALKLRICFFQMPKFGFDWKFRGIYQRQQILRHRIHLRLREITLEQFHLLALSNIEIFSPYQRTLFISRSHFLDEKKNFHFISEHRQVFSSTAIAKNRSLLISLGKIPWASRELADERKIWSFICRCWT